MDISKEFNATIRSCTFTWTTDYSAIVHEGAVLTNGTVLPARPWTETGMQNFEFEEVFGKLFDRYLDVDRAFKEACYLLSRKFTEEISDPKWEWSDGNLRDIVDTGLLRASQQVEFS